MRKVIQKALRSGAPTILWLVRSPPSPRTTVSMVDLMGEREVIPFDYPE